MATALSGLEERAAHPVRFPAMELPPRLRPDAKIGVLDATEWFGESSGGIRTYLMQKAAYVARHASVRQQLIVPGATDSVADHAGVRIYRLSGPRIPGQAPYRLLLSPGKIGRVVEHEQPNIIELSSALLVPWLLKAHARRLGIPMIAFYHSNLPALFAPRDGYDSAARSAAYQCAWKYMRRLDGLMQLTVATSRYAITELASNGIERVVHVPLGVDLDLFNPALRNTADDTRNRFGIPDGPVAAFIGRFAREKELALLLDAWSVVERSCGARLVLIGAGPMESQLRAHAYADRVTFIAFQKERAEIARLLSAIDVYVTPGRLETFGLASLEAIACGTPVLCADEGGVQEQVIASGAGRVFEAGNAVSLAEEAIALFRGDLATQGSQGRQFVEKEHSWDGVFDRLFAVYATVIAAQRER